MFFVALSIAKEGYDDLRRHRMDKIENTREATVLHAYEAVDEPVERPQDTTEITSRPQRAGPLHWATVKWEELKVGDIVRLKRDDPVPADLVLLQSSGENNIAYVET